MKAFADTIAVILVFASCYTNTTKGNGIEMSSMVDSVGSDYTANATAIEQKKQEMLAVADSVGHFWFHDDTEFQSQDPHAYWLMNRMGTLSASGIKPHRDTPQIAKGKTWLWR